MPQALQNKPIRLVIGFPAGGPIDTVARLLAPHLTEGFGQQVIIDNRAGANGILAMDIVAKVAPDGHTLFFGTTGNLAINPAMYTKLPFDRTHDFAPVSHVASTSSLIYAHPSVPARNLGEFIAHASANPGKMLYASSGNGGMPHLGGRAVERGGQNQNRACAVYRHGAGLHRAARRRSAVSPSARWSRACST